MSKRMGRGQRRTRKSRRASGPAGTAGSQLSGELTTREAGSFRTPIAGPVDVSDLARVVPHLAPETLHQLIRARRTRCLWRDRRLGDTDAVGICPRPRFVAERATGTRRAFRHRRASANGWKCWSTPAAPWRRGPLPRWTSTSSWPGSPGMYASSTRRRSPAIVDGEPLDIDVPPHTGPECEVGGYLVRGITTDAWDAIVALLLALDADHHDRFHAVMRECRRLSNSTPEVDGLDDLLMEPEQLLHDVGRDREHRRSQQGYSTPADARAFLLMARRRRRASRGEPSVNPLVAAYFRAANDTTRRCRADLPATRAAFRRHRPRGVRRRRRHARQRQAWCRSDPAGCWKVHTLNHHVSRSSER